MLAVRVGERYRGERLVVRRSLEVGHRTAQGDADHRSRSVEREVTEWLSGFLVRQVEAVQLVVARDRGDRRQGQVGFLERLDHGESADAEVRRDPIDLPDRKSTRLNSSHVSISYA